ncbi:MAG: elongation factor G, partial [Gemmatimonadaceae bacterium]|nr:elongation factor G [Gemmatimonadaceae bacterium]
LHADDDAPFAALVFKTQSEPHVGTISYLRVLSGSMTAGADVHNATRDGTERLANLAAPLGRERVEVLRVHAGDICTVAKLRNTHTNDTLSTRAHPIRLPAIALPEPLVHFAVRATSRNDEEKLQVGLHALHDEDPTLEVHLDAETHETILSGLGERHVEVALARLTRRYGVGAELAAPRIAYREALFGTGSARGRHKKQSGGRGQFGDCHVTISPLPRGEGYVFVDSIVGGAIPSKYIPAVDAGIREAAQRGVLAGAPVVDFRAEVTDGSFHSVDSSELAFRLAGILAFKAAVAQCRPALLEPIDSVEMEVPTAVLGDVLGDVSSRRGHILGTDSAGPRMTVVRATIPRAELHLYATHLRGLTHGNCRFRARAAGYEVAPAEVSARVVEAAQKAQQETHHG